jgi:hypothetical protein
VHDSQSPSSADRRSALRARKSAGTFTDSALPPSVRIGLPPYVLEGHRCAGVFTHAPLAAAAPRCAALRCAALRKACARGCAPAADGCGVSARHCAVARRQAAGSTSWKMNGYLEGEASLGESGVPGSRSSGRDGGSAGSVDGVPGSVENEPAAPLGPRVGGLPPGAGVGAGVGVGGGKVGPLPPVQAAAPSTAQIRIAARVIARSGRSCVCNAPAFTAAPRSPCVAALRQHRLPPCHASGRCNRHAAVSVHDRAADLSRPWSVLPHVRGGAPQPSAHAQAARLERALGPIWESGALPLPQSLNLGRPARAPGCRSWTSSASLASRAAPSRGPCR